MKTFEDMVDEIALILDFSRDEAVEVIEAVAELSAVTGVGVHPYTAAQMILRLREIIFYDSSTDTP